VIWEPKSAFGWLWKSVLGVKCCSNTINMSMLSFPKWTEHNNINDSHLWNTNQNRPYQKSWSCPITPGLLLLTVPHSIINSSKKQAAESQFIRPPTCKAHSPIKSCFSESRRRE
jgi:hypothetical protein